MNRTTNFIHEAQNMARTRDGEIEHIDFKGGGVRVSGFLGISAGHILPLLHKYGKRCSFTNSHGKLVCDVYDDVPASLDQEGEVPRGIESLPTPERFAKADETTTGAITITRYSVVSLTSNDLSLLLSGKNAVDVYVEAGFVSVMAAVGSSLVAGGVHDQVRRRVIVHRPRPRMSGKLPLFKATRKRQLKWLAYLRSFSGQLTST